MHFEDFIYDMPEEDYQMWLESDATEKQKAVAQRIREQVPEAGDIDQPPQVRKENAINRFISRFRSILGGKKK